MGDAIYLCLNLHFGESRAKRMLLKVIKVLKLVLSGEAQVLVTLLRIGFVRKRDDQAGLTSASVASHTNECRKLSLQWVRCNFFSVLGLYARVTSFSRLSSNRGPLL